MWGDLQRAYYGTLFTACMNSMNAPGWAWRTPDIGRKLHGIARRAGFSRVTLEVLTKPDLEGRLLDMIRTVARYARKGAQLEPERIDAALESAQMSLADGTYLAVTPQFIVTATT